MPHTRLSLWPLTYLVAFLLVGAGIGSLWSMFLHGDFQLWWAGVGALVAFVMFVVCSLCYLVFDNPFTRSGRMFQNSQAYARTMRVWSALLGAELMAKGLVPYDNQSMFLPFIPAVSHNDNVPLVLRDEPCVRATQRQAARSLPFYQRLLFLNMVHNPVALTKPSAHTMLATHQRLP